MIKLNFKLEKLNQTEKLQNSKLSMRESMRGDFFSRGVGGRWLALILSLCDGGFEINFCLMRGGV